MGRYRGERTARLNQLWAEWSGLLENVLHRRKSVARVSDDKYRELHQELLAEIQCQVERCKSAQNSPPKEMLKLAAPWLSLDALLGADRHVLAVLVTQVNAVGSRLPGPTAPKRWMKVAIPLLIALVSGVVVTWYFRASETGDISHWIQEWQHLAYRLQRAVVKSSMLAKLSVLAVIVVGMGTLLLRSMRQD